MKETKRMKRTSLLTSLLVVGLLISMIAINIGTAAPTAVLSVEPAKVTGKVGDTFTVDFMVSDVTDLYSWQIFAQYDANIVNYSRWWEGPFLRGNPATTLDDRGLDHASGPYDIYEKTPTSWSGSWTNPGGVQSSDDNYATTSTPDATEIYGDFDFPDTTMLSIFAVDVIVESNWDHVGQNLTQPTDKDEIYVQVSNDGGSTWGSSQTVQGATTPTDYNRTLDVTGDFDWTPSMLSNANFKVKTTYHQVGVNATTFYVDLIQVRVTDALPVDTSTAAHDGVLTSYASFPYGFVDGFFAVGNFTGDPASTDSTIKKVDMKVKYSATASTLSDQYRIVYYVGSTDTPGTKGTLVDWTSASASLQTFVSEDTLTPSGGGWTWADLKKIHIAFETDKVDGDSAAIIDLYEAFVTVVYEVPTFTVTNVQASSVAISSSILGPLYSGINGRGVLASMEFTIKSMGDTTIDIQGVIGPNVLTLLSDSDNKDIPCSKEDGLFFEPWPEDVYPDGIIDIRDIAEVGLHYGMIAGGEFTNAPSTWAPYGTVGWVYPENVVSSNNVYADSQLVSKVYSKGVFEDYGFGFTSGTVAKVEVGIEMYGDGAKDQVDLTVSNDGGSTWAATTHTVACGTSEATSWIDVTADFTWTVGMLLDGSLAVLMEYVKGGGGGATIHVDWLPVRVTIAGPDLPADVDGSGIVDIMDLAMVAIKYGTIYIP